MGRPECSSCRPLRAQRHGPNRSRSARRSRHLLEGQRIVRKSTAGGSQPSPSLVARSRPRARSSPCDDPLAGDLGCSSTTSRGPEARRGRPPRPFRAARRLPTRRFSRPPARPRRGAGSRPGSRPRPPVHRLDLRVAGGVAEEQAAGEGMRLDVGEPGVDRAAIRCPADRRRRGARARPGAARRSDARAGAGRGPAWRRSGRRRPAGVTPERRAISSTEAPW